MLLAASPAFAQLQLPGLPGGGGLGLPGRIGLPDAGQLRERLLNTSELADRIRLDQLRLTQAAELLRRYPAALEADPHGFPAVRRSIIAWSPSPAGLAAARAAGLTLVSEQRLAELDQAVVTFHVPESVSTADALTALRAADPDGVYDFDHIYTGSGAAGAGADAGRADRGGGAGSPAGPVRVGLVDSGVESGHAVFADATIRRWGCDGKEVAAAHGTAVAALMVGRSDRFSGVAPGGGLYAADIYCDQPTGGAASLIAGALAWLAREQVGVINLSLVGPPNQLLERAVSGMIKRGHLLVAAVGNDGPAAPPLYPASYPGVVGVTGVDARRRPLPEAARGPQVMFAAPGSQMVTAAVGAPPYRSVRGTSFASPIVAALLAGSLPRPDPAGARAAIGRLAGMAGNPDMRGQLQCDRLRRGRRILPRGAFRLPLKIIFAGMEEIGIPHRSPSNSSEFVAALNQENAYEYLQEHRPHRYFPRLWRCFCRSRGGTTGRCAGRRRLWRRRFRRRIRVHRRADRRVAERSGVAAGSRFRSRRARRCFFGARCRHRCAGPRR
ncbi:S8 family serine peptidase [Pseudoduganella sp. UC29_106]|uniref:S8 family serine peptidase n=1 Tax=Pseudoduganella sp. UC29_106 TaxID=3374553 RepID=UPI003756B771